MSGNKRAAPEGTDNPKDLKHNTSHAEARRHKFEALAEKIQGILDWTVSEAVTETKVPVSTEADIRLALVDPGASFDAEQDIQVNLQWGPNNRKIEKDMAEFFASDIDVYSHLKIPAYSATTISKGLLLLKEMGKYATFENDDDAGAALTELGYRADRLVVIIKRHLSVRYSHKWLVIPRCAENLLAIEEGDLREIEKGFTRLDLRAGGKSRVVMLKASSGRTYTIKKSAIVGIEYGSAIWEYGGQEAYLTRSAVVSLGEYIGLEDVAQLCAATSGISRILKANDLTAVE